MMGLPCSMVSINFVLKCLQQWAFPTPSCSTVMLTSPLKWLPLCPSWAGKYESILIISIPEYKKLKIPPFHSVYGIVMVVLSIVSYVTLLQYTFIQHFADLQLPFMIDHTTFTCPHKLM
ncbi:uncharacterized protein [Rhodnius prolixus]|uniref:uncharacterized protein n=1 Tax=Rhodnius prolixus TaxID=13249 RepID=UPI003D18C6CF